ncbi:hypothetical protein [Leptospira sp. 'Mane']|uniref:hypothetical protein n=1 Tax=Leptospira sp. 'Mane' TaxID=3387407 RepID=UPI00398B40C3
MGTKRISFPRRTNLSPPDALTLCRCFVNLSKGCTTLDCPNAFARSMIAQMENVKKSNLKNTDSKIKLNKSAKIEVPDRYKNPLLMIAKIKNSQPIPRKIEMGPSRLNLFLTTACVIACLPKLLLFKSDFTSQVVETNPENWI